MFDKRESRRMNRVPFRASVKRWRDKNLTNSSDVDASADAKTPSAINVYARKRPLFDPEKKRGEYDVVSIKNGSTAVVHNCQMHADLKRMFVKHCAYTLSGGVFDEDAQEHDVYARSAAPLVAGTLKGSVGALFMYGQTGSGKTHTMENIEKHAIEALFVGDGDAPGAKSIKVSYFEIAGKTCVDLLQPGRVEIRLKELFEEQGGELTGQMEVELMGAKEPVVTSASDLKKVIDEGKSRRQTSATQCNASSSRSHAVMRLTVSLSDGSTGRLTLVDCAGSERKEDNTHHNEKQRKETAEINASLYALKECVRFRRLRFSGTGNSNVHVPYRNSPLTRVLAECFVRKDAGVAVIGTMSPASIDTEHSLATLKTINAIGGNEDSEGYVEEKEDVAATLRVDAKTGQVTEEAAERLIAPVKWSREEVAQWLSSTARGAFKSVKVPTTLTGSQFVRMSPLVLKNMCGGDDALATKLHKCLRAEVTRCSVQQR
jgi:kinesin family protein 2/24